MEYESPTIELLADSEMANVQGLGPVWYASVALVYALAVVAGIAVAVIGVGVPILYYKRRR